MRYTLHGLILSLSLIIIVITGGSCRKSKDKGGGVLAAQHPVVSTIAGNGTDAWLDGPAMSASFHSPADVAVAADGTVYVADYNSGRIRKIAGGQVSTLAGNGSAGYVNGNGASARIETPYRVAVDAAGNVYVLQQVDPRVRKITPAGDVTTYAGVAQNGFLNGDVLTAQFNVNAGGIATDAQGNVYTGDTFNGRIRKIGGGQVSTLAGTGAEGSNDGDGAQATFRYPNGIATDAQGNIYVVDDGNFCIRKVTPAGYVTRFAGSGTRGRVDGNAATAQFYSPDDIVVDSHGNLYVVDDNYIRKVTPQGDVTTIAGSSTKGYVDGDGADAKFRDIGGIGIDAQGSIYVADINNNRIRKISFPNQ